MELNGAAVMQAPYFFFPTASLHRQQHQLQHQLEDKMQDIQLGERKQARRKRIGTKSNRLLIETSGRLVESFSEYLASRNVINRSERYNKIGNLRADQSGERPASRHRAAAAASLKRPVRLLGVVFRAPAVLAALFSLFLVASLFVLYALSFNRLHMSLHQAYLAASSTDDGGVASSSHKIGSRHIKLNATLSSSMGRLSRLLSVQTECGTYIGKPESGAIAFKGIPYAHARRWSRPQPIWAAGGGQCAPSAVFEAFDYQAHCAQLSPVSQRFSGREDCLYLDIFAPQLDQLKKLPVMVYIHGGFLTYGSSGEGQVNWMSGRPSSQLASELNVVLVAFNFRLQALGFLALEQLAQNNGPNGSEGNYGLWDQLVALNWIKRNIESFGGDPSNIVLFGPDSASALPLALLNHLGQPMGSRLFRAAWLTNPTVYYDFPYELASQHHRHLLMASQPLLSTTTSMVEPALRPQANATSSKQATTLASCLTNFVVPNFSQQQSNQMKPQAPNQHQKPKVSSGSPLVDCLLSLEPEQILRQFLGQDDPSFRLDDQNSLPLHGIFADQLVVIENELVQMAAYPINTQISFAKTVKDFPNESQNAAQVGAEQDKEEEVEEESEDFLPDLLLGSSAQAAEYWPCPRNLDQWNWTDFERYVSTSLNSFSSKAFKSARDLYEKSPTNSTESSTDSIRAHSSSSSSSFSSLKQRSFLEMSPSPKEAYLSMVSDIRQICPINELAASLAARGHRVQRYIVETIPDRSSSGGPIKSATFLPSSPVVASTSAPAYSLPPGASNEAASAAKTTTTNQKHADHLGQVAFKRPQFAFHMFDLMAFFGFNPADLSSAEIGQRELTFQAEIRKMVTDFLHMKKKHNSNINKQTKYTQTLTNFTLFDKFAKVKSVTNYKQTECRMWHKHLGHSYAWVS